MENSIYEAEITLSVTLMFRSGSDQEAQKEVPQVAKQLAHQIMQIEKVDGVEIKETSAPQEFFPYKISFGFGELTVWARNIREAKQKFLCSITESIAEIEEVK